MASNNINSTNASDDTATPDSSIENSNTQMDYNARSGGNLRAEGKF